MPLDTLSNGAQTTLNGAINNSQTTATLTSASGWPAAPFRALITAEGGNTDELIYVGARSGTALSSITRAAEALADGTQSAQAHSSGATITQVLTAATLTNAITFMGVAAYNSTTQTVANTTETKLTFNTEDYDTNAIHDTVTNPTRFTVPTGGAGKWTAVAYCAWDANASGTVRYMWWSLNGTRIRSSLASNPGAGFGLDQRSTLEPVVLADGDYIEVSAYQDSGGTRTTGNASGDQRNMVTFWRVG